MSSKTIVTMTWKLPRCRTETRGTSDQMTRETRRTNRSGKEKAPKMEKKTKKIWLLRSKRRERRNAPEQSLRNQTTRSSRPKFARNLARRTRGLRPSSRKDLRNRKRSPKRAKSPPRRNSWVSASESGAITTALTRSSLHRFALTLLAVVHSLVTSTSIHTSRVTRASENVSPLSHIFECS